MMRKKNLLTGGFTTPYTRLGLRPKTPNVLGLGTLMETGYGQRHTSKTLVLTLNAIFIKFVAPRYFCNQNSASD